MTETEKKIVGEINTLKVAVKDLENAVATFLVNKTQQPQSDRRYWHPSDEAALEKYLELAIKEWAHNFSRTEFAIKYKIAKIIKDSGVKV